MGNKENGSSNFIVVLLIIISVMTIIGAPVAITLLSDPMYLNESVESSDIERVGFTFGVIGLIAVAIFLIICLVKGCIALFEWLCFILSFIRIMLFKKDKHWPNHYE